MPETIKSNKPLPGSRPSCTNDGLCDSELAHRIKEAQENLQAYRYGVTWDGGPQSPLRAPMPDGYWVPWHVAALFIARIRDVDADEGSL